jgi:hypothetical protein
VCLFVIDIMLTLCPSNLNAQQQDGWNIAQFWIDFLLQHTPLSGFQSMHLWVLWKISNLFIWLR